MEQWYEDSQEGSRLQPAGWPGQPTAPGLSAALLRMRRHTQMALLSLDAMTRGPSNKRWGIIDRLAARDVIVFIDAAFEALRLAALIVAETSTGTPAPATNEDRQALKAALAARETGLRAISDRLDHRADPQIASTSGQRRQRDGPLSDKRICPICLGYARSLPRAELPFAALRADTVVDAHFRAQLSPPRR